uniref:phosphoethanolamine N-methyltransferase n=1 Tax=Lepisosteus oculatus TaxID=7918 RepID=W5M481_LEPOC
CLRPAVVRHKMTEFWQEHSQQATVEEMMLDSNAQLLTQHELPEILALLPDLEGLTVLELGAGIGSGTESLLVFSSWSLSLCDSLTVFPYLCLHSEMTKSSAVYKLTLWVAQRPVSFALCPDGTYPPLTSGHQREGLQIPLYCCLIGMFPSPFQMKNNQNQLCWLLQKLPRDRSANGGFDTFQQFLDSQQYSRRGILRYEKIFGRGYVSTGGPSTTKEFVDLLNLSPGQRVLDVGCGIGGGDFYMAKTFGAQVLGMDLSSNMVEIAMERAQEEHLPLVREQLQSLHCQRKSFSQQYIVLCANPNCHRLGTPIRGGGSSAQSWLKPGGKLLISDYCCGEKPWSPQFEAYVCQRGYTLYTPQRYGKFLEEAGFGHVRAEDRTAQFIKVIKAELERAEGMRQEFIE